MQKRMRIVAVVADALLAPPTNMEPAPGAVAPTTLAAAVEPGGGGGGAGG